MSAIISLDNVSMNFGGTSVLKNLSLDVKEGSVYAFLGRNGTGKTTTIRILLGLLEQQAGLVSVLGMNPLTDGHKLMQEIGYVSEDSILYGWMTAEEIINMTAAFYERWDKDYERELVERLSIKRDRKVNKMSRGQKGRLALLLALAYRPKLLLLDEPTSGLDAVVRRQFIEESIDVISEEGRTIFFSTHLISEVERIADHVGVLSGGAMTIDTTAQDLKDRFRSIHAFFNHDVEEVQAPASVFNFRRFKREVLFFTENFDQKIVEDLKNQGAARVEVNTMSLDDIFVEATRMEDE
jgi:ABC-2 type transport system ATP-binding protein